MTLHEIREKRVEKWLSTIVRDSGIDRYDDLHVDQIDPGWAAKEEWIRAGLEAFGIAARLRDFHGMELTVVLAFSLESGEEPRGVTFRTSSELQAELDWSPPSLYLFPAKHEPWIERCGDFVTLDASLVFNMPEGLACYYMEFKSPESAEYSRSVFLAG